MLQVTVTSYNIQRVQMQSQFNLNLSLDYRALFCFQ